MPPITIGVKALYERHLMQIVQVNQRYWLQLGRGLELQGRHYTFDMCLVPQYLPKEESLEEWAR